jgi:NADH:ubiquinone oxidoreductase subunit F (NADH-binding)
MGTPLRQILALAGASAGSGSGQLKALLVGGPSGGILPAELADTAYDYDSLRAVGAHIGSGAIVAADQRACVVDLARLLTRFCADEACGKTIPCRIGLRRVSEIGDRVATGVPRPTDVQLLADLSADIVGSALCDHERLATLPFASGMRYFQSELDEHILRSSCPAGVCRPIAVAAGAAH